MTDIEKTTSVIPNVSIEENTTKNSIYLVSDGKVHPLKLESVKSYIMSVCQKVNTMHLNIDKLSIDTYSKLKILNTITEIENQIVSTASEMVVYHYDYSLIATYILVDNLHNNTFTDYLSVVEKMASNINKKGQRSPIVNDDFVNFVREHHQEINAALRYERDFNISVFGFRTLEKAYLKRFYNGKIIERPQHLYMRVAIALHMNSGPIEKIIETYDLLSLGFFTHATPTLFNAGTICQQLSSCFLLGVEDDMEAIGECWKNCAVISKYAGGLGLNATNIRVNGSYIASTQGYASGLRLLHVFNEIARYADQGGKRAGSIAIYIEPWHGDIFYFLDLKKNTGAETERARDLFLGLMVNDIFMQRVKEDGMWSLMCPNECPDLLDKFGTEFTKIYEQYEADGKYLKQIKARDLFFKIMEAQIETGVPYVIFKDAVNYKSNHINIGVINGSNLCVAGETQILTSKGYFDIQSKVDQKVEVWNGEEFSEVTVRKTGTDQELVEVKFSNGSKLKCTPYHKFYIQKDNQTVEIQAIDLQTDDKLIDMEYPIIKKGLNTDIGDNEVPINHNMKIKIEWFSDLFDDDDGINYYYENGDNLLSVNIVHKNKKFLTDIKYMLQTMGCNPFIINKNGKSHMYELKIGPDDMFNLINLGFEPEFLTDGGVRRVNYSDPIRVQQVRKLEKTEDTYCFTEPKRHMGIFNGVITGQCAEIVEFHNSNEYSVCNLSTICLPKYVVKSEDKISFDYQKLYQVARVVTRNLDNIIDINFYPVDKTKVSNLKHRPIGIGVQGLADLFYQFKIPFDSKLAKDLNKKIFETIYFGAMTESVQLAKERGAYSTFEGSPFSKGQFQFNLWGLDDTQLSGMWDWSSLRSEVMTYGTRNSLLTTCPPTASTSQIAGNNETVEPYTENIYTRNTLAGDYYIINRYLMKDLMDIGLWDSDMVDLIKYFKGSIAKLPMIPEHIKQIYRTVWEIPQQSIIEMAADRAPFIDQTQSMNIFIDKPNFVKLTSCLFRAWELGLKTGMYYLRSKAASEANQFGIDINNITELLKKYSIDEGTEEEVQSQLQSKPKIKSESKVCKFMPKHLRKIEDCEVCSS